MYYTNSMTLTMLNATTATAALDILRTRLSAGFDCDKKYAYAPAQSMSDALFTIGEVISLPESFGGYLPEDATSVFLDLYKALAEHLPTDSFTCETYNASDCDECAVDAHFDCNTLTVKTTYFPNGFSEFLFCDECGCAIVHLDEYEKGKIYICPDCGVEIDLSNAYEEYKSEVIEIINFK